MKQSRTYAAMAVLGMMVFIACSDDDDATPGEPSAGAAGKAGSGSGGTSGDTSAGTGGTKPSAGAASDAGGSSTAGAAGEPAVGGETAGGTGSAEQGGEAGWHAGGAGGAPPPNVELDPAPSRDTLLGVQGGEQRTLYFFGNDVPGDAGREPLSACTGECVETWPVFHVSTVVVGAGLSKGDFGELRRPDGTYQSTYKGWPLYTHTGDATPTDRSGDGVEAVWHAAEEPFYAFTLRRSDVDGTPTLHLATSSGMSIYTFNDDLPGTETLDPVSGCVSAGCRRLWPVVPPLSAKAVSSITGAFDPFVRSDTKQVQLAYDGLPLYTYADDLSPGDISGLEKTNWVLASP